MAILSFGPGDVLKKIVVEPGWFPATITEIKMKPSKEAKSVNYWACWTLESGKEIEVCYNTATKNRSILGTAQFSPTVDLMEIYCASKSMAIPKEGLTIDSDDLVGIKLDIQVTRETADGIIFNGVNAYMPLGASQEVAKKLQF